MPMAQGQPYYRSRSRRIRDRVARLTAPLDRQRREPHAATAVARDRGHHRPVTNTAR